MGLVRLYLSAMYYMTFQEDKDNASQLSLWANNDKKVLIEIQPISNDDPMMYQFVELNRNDTSKLIQELQRILDEFEID